MVSYDYTIEAGGTGAWWFVASDSGGQWLSHIDPRGVKWHPFVEKFYYIAR